jgi:hypothetical protein
MKMMSWSRYHCLPWYLMHIRIRPRRSGPIRPDQSLRRRRHPPANDAGAGLSARAPKPSASNPSVSKPSVSKPSVSKPSVSNS